MMDIYIYTWKYWLYSINITWKVATFCGPHILNVIINTGQKIHEKKKRAGGKIGEIFLLAKFPAIW